MKRTLFSLALLAMVQTTVAQDAEKNAATKDVKNNATSHALKDNEFSPQLYLGTFNENPAQSALSFDVTDNKLKLQGLIYDDSAGVIVWSAKVTAASENSVFNIFSGTQLNSKASAETSVTIKTGAWLKYYTKKKINDKLFVDNTEYEALNKEAELKASQESNIGFDKEAYKYQKMSESPDKYMVSKSNFTYLTFGVTGTGGKYYLVDTNRALPDMVSKRNFSALEVWGQFNFLSYKHKSNRARLHSWRVNYQEINNVSDLDEISITSSSSFSDGSNARKFELKKTGYYDCYKIQHQSIWSYEFNMVPMNEEKMRLGFLTGLDFVYRSKDRNFWRVHGGLNFPIKTKKGNIVYVAALVRSTDPINMKGKDNFKFKDTFSGEIRLGTPLNINFKKDTKKKEEKQK